MVNESASVVPVALFQGSPSSLRGELCNEASSARIMFKRCARELSILCCGMSM